MVTVTNDIFEKALIFAIKKHSGQTRKGNKLAYIIHPMRVAVRLQQAKVSKNMNLLLAACILHDVSEDCDVSIAEIARKFGYAVASLVEELTLDKTKYATIGKTKYLCEEVLKMTSYALAIKLCDRLDNVVDLKDMPLEFKLKYKDETLEIMETLIKNRKLTGTHQKLVALILKELKNN